MRDPSTRCLEPETVLPAQNPFEGGGGAKLNALWVVPMSPQTSSNSPPEPLDSFSIESSGEVAMGEGVRPRGEALALALLRLAALPESGRRGVEVCEDACSVRYGCDETPDGWNDKEAVTKPGLRDRANREGFVIDSSAAICRRLFSIGFIALNVPDGNGGTPTNDLIGATFGGCGGRVMSRLFERSPRALKRRRKARCTRQTEAFFRK